MNFLQSQDLVLQDNMAIATASIDTVVAPQTPCKINNNQCGELKEYILHDIVDSTCGSSNNPLEECVPKEAEPSQDVSRKLETEGDILVDLDTSEAFERGKQDSDLNRTPQQKPRRKKHRPKVVTEEKVEKTAKTVNLETEEKTAIKRKYVRKSNVDNPLESPESVLREDNVGGTPVKRKYTGKRKEINPLGEQNIIDSRNICRNQSVKRSLDFDLNVSQTDELYTQANEASDAVKDVLRFQTTPATHSFTNDTGNGCVRSPQTPSQPQQLSRLELVKKRWREEFDGLVFNKRPRKKGECLNKLDNGIECMDSKQLIQGQTDPRGTKRDQTHIDEGWVHTNSCRNTNNMQDSNKGFTISDGRKLSNHKSVASHVTKDSTNIQILHSNQLSCPVKSFIQDNHACNQPSTSKVVLKDVSYGPKACVKALISCQTKAQTTKRRRKEQNQPVNSISENEKRMEHIIEHICTKLKCLNIYNVRENVREESHNALVPFIGSEMLVPFSSPPEIMKKKKPRAKVDLDDESQIMWNLLMGKESDSGEGLDADRENWWENERRIFLGRTESFTARMHLIQGDRKFSPWKGSVVDSVIGVFLTQNVSDHLSSSAFMSLAAKFPIKSKPFSTTTNVKTKGVPIVTEPNFFDQDLPGIFYSSQQGDRELSYSTESCFSDRGVGNESPASVLGSTVDGFAITAEGEEDKIRSAEHADLYINNFTSFTELLHMANSGVILDLNATSNKSMSAKYGGVSDWSSSCSQKEPYLGNPVEPLHDRESMNKSTKIETEKKAEYDWDSLRRQVSETSFSKERCSDAMDSMDYEALKNAEVSEIASAIRERGMNNLLAERIKAFLERLERDHGSVDLEWLRHAPPDKAKDYLLSIWGLGLKSVECIRLLTLHQLAFPVDTNVARISVRLGWVPIQPLPESLQIHLLEMYPIMETIQKYLWPRLCKLDQKKLYELHYQLITFGKVFCTKNKPNCNACPMRGECKHFASAYASTRLALPGPEEKRIVNSEINTPIHNAFPFPQHMGLTDYEGNTNDARNYDPIIEEPSTPDPEHVEATITDIEDDYYNDYDEIPTIKLNIEELSQSLRNYMHENHIQLQDGNLSRALVILSPEAASIPAPKLKNVSRLRTEHQVYELPDGHPLLEGMDNRDPDDPCKYMLAIWTPGETAHSTEAPKSCSVSQDSGKMCDLDTCFSCNSKREAQSQTVRGTILIPCRTANRGSFPLNGTYFQVNEVFADHDSSHFPIDVPRKWLWNLNRRTVYFGSSIPSIFKGLTMEEIQHCFWRGFVCVRGFDRSTRAPKPLFVRLHFPASKITRTKRTSEASTSADTKSTVIAKQKGSVSVEKFESRPDDILPQTFKDQSPIDLIIID